jgi:hypothetical protein
MEAAGEHRAADKEAKKNRALEVAVAALLALTTVASAWCAYQAERWGGIQVFRLNDSDAADRKALELSIRANQARMLDVSMFIQFINAMKQGNKALEQFYLERFRPEMRTAVDAWLAARPTTNGSAPPHPFAMPEYRLASAEEAQEARETAQRYHDAATEAKHASDQYVLLTVLLASVLFFGGIATHFGSSLAKIGLFSLAIMAFLGTLFWLSTCPRAP